MCMKRTIIALRWEQGEGGGEKRVSFGSGGASEVEDNGPIAERNAHNDEDEDDGN